MSQTDPHALTAHRAFQLGQADILDFNSPARVAIRRDALARDQLVEDEAAEYGCSVLDLLSERWLHAHADFLAMRNRLIAEREKGNTP